MFVAQECVGLGCLFVTSTWMFFVSPPYSSIFLIGPMVPYEWPFYF
jgi:hypothetical protein